MGSQAIGAGYAVAPELPLRDTGSLRGDLTTQMQNFARMRSGCGGRMLRSFLAAARSDPEVAEAFRTIWSEPRRSEAKAMLRQKQSSGQLREDSDLDLVLDSLYGPLYYRFLVKNEPPSLKYAESLAALVIGGLGAAGHAGRAGEERLEGLREREASRTDPVEKRNGPAQLAS